MGCGASASENHGHSSATSDVTTGVDDDLTKSTSATGKVSDGSDKTGAVSKSADGPDVVQLSASLPTTRASAVLNQIPDKEVDPQSPEYIKGFAEGRLIIEDTQPLNKVYKLGGVEDKLSDGAHGAIIMCTNRKTGLQRAVKTLRRKKIKSRWFTEMIRIQKLLDHPNICVLYEIFEDKLNFYCVQDLCSGGHLLNAICSAPHFTESDAACVLRRILRAVAYMHLNFICHRDICPENLMVHKPTEDMAQLEPKIIDFGAAKRFQEDRPMKETVGSPSCMSPQVLLGSYTQLCDVWSCGVFLFAILVGEPPFIAESDERLEYLVRSGVVEFDPDSWNKVSDEGTSLAKALLAKEEKDRPSAADALNMPWFGENDSSAATLKENHLTNLATFVTKNKLEKAALHTIAQRLRSEEIEELRKIFETLDKNNSGTVSLSELKDGIHADLPMCAEEISLGKLRRVVDAIDVNGTSEINYTEFLAAAMDQRCLKEEAWLWTAFRHFDKDNSGEIDKEELHKILLMEDAEDIVDHACIDRIMKESDFNGNGRIDFDEFVCMMRHEKYVPRKFDKGNVDTEKMEKAAEPRLQPNSYMRPHANVMEQAHLQDK